MSETKKDNGFTRWSKNTLSFGSLLNSRLPGAVHLLLS